MPAANAAHLKALTVIPNVGPATARDLVRLGITAPDDLRGHDADELYDRLCAQDGVRYDICLRDTFAAAISYSETGDARPWWHHSRERKAAALGVQIASRTAPGAVADANIAPPTGPPAGRPGN